MVKWNIGTYARLRPPRRGHDCAKFMLDKIDDGRQSAAIIAFPPPDDDDERLHMKQREALQFRFSDIFDPSVSQDQVFNRVCLDIVYSALDGFNGTILAYGQTGSGKTYTITGGEHYADRGIIPRVLSTIFEEFEQRTSVRYSCYISYLEIYNENVYDLLDRSHTDRPIEEWTKVLLMDDDEGEMHFRNLGVYEAVSEEEALNLLFLGNMNRVTSDTPMNQASSRSHSIFTVMIEARPVDSDLIVTSKLHLVDLAGSERVYKREGTQRMRSEGKHINLSLHHLEQVILSLRSKKNAVAKGYHIPYRNSMLTSVLRGSLGGNCKSVFIATLNPENDFVDESISSCRFMQRCSEVSVDIAVNTEIDSEKRIEALEKANSALEHTNFELHGKVVQLETDLKSSREQLSRQQQQHGAQLQQIQSHAQQQISAVKALSSGVGGPVDWTKCEELVEKLLLTGDLPREQLESDDFDDEGEDDNERVYARKMHQEVTQELKKLGMEYAIACLAVMKENLFFASNTAVELQDMMSKQSLTVEFLEKRLHEQKREAEQMKLQIQHLTEESQSHAASSGDTGPATMIPRSKSHSGAVSKRSHRAPPSRQNSSRDDSSSVQDFGTDMGLDDDSDSDSDEDSDISTHSCSQYSHQRQQIAQNGRTAKSSSQASTQGGQSTMALLIAPLGSGSSRSLKTTGGGERDASSVAESHHRSSHDESSRHNSSSSFKDNAIRNGTLPDSDDSRDTASPPLKSGSSDMIRKRMELLKNGSLFVKYGRFGKPHVRFVWCSQDLEYLNYRTISKQGPKASIPTRSISKIHLGQATKVFERAKQGAREPFCFSVEYEDHRTLDLEIADGEGVELKKQKRTEWADALQFLVKLKAVQQKKPPAPPVGGGAPPAATATAQS